MKITRVSAEADARLRDQPIADALQVLDTQGTCRIAIETDDGITGHGDIGFGRLLAAPAILAHLVNDELAPEALAPALEPVVQDQADHPRADLEGREPRAGDL